MEQKIVITIHPESQQYCGDCDLLHGVNYPYCRAGFQPEWEDRRAVRPATCREAATVYAISQQALIGWDLLP